MLLFIDAHLGEVGKPHVPLKGFKKRFVNKNAMTPTLRDTLLIFSAKMIHLPHNVSKSPEFSSTPRSFNYCESLLLL